MHHEQLVAVDIREAARRLSLSPRTVATLVSQGQLQSKKVGRRRIVPVTALEAFVAHSTASRESREPNVRRPIQGRGKACDVL